MNIKVEQTKFTQQTSNSSETAYFAEAKRRLEYLRIMGLCDGPIKATSKEIEQWCEDRNEDPEIAQLDNLAAHKVYELDTSYYLK